MEEEFPVIRSDRLSLRAVTLDDSDFYHRLLSIPEETQYSDLPDSPSQKRSERFISWMSKLYLKGNGCAWIIEDREMQLPMGVIRINEIYKKDKRGELGYELHPQYWGLGIMSEAVALVTQCAHKYFLLNRLEAWTLPGNDASDRVLLKNGFIYEGTLRQKAYFKNKYQDLRIFSHLADDVCSE